MKLRSLELWNFRNHRKARAPLGGASMLLLGPNGSGKTNFIEAAVLLSLGRSFRGARDRDLVHRDAESFEVRGVVEGRGGVEREVLARGVREGAREVRVDGEPLPRLTDLLGRFPTVHFSVDDVAVFGGGVPERRRFLDVALCQLEPLYVGFLREYGAALKQRNRLLLGSPGSDEIGVWEAILARTGLELDRRREGLARELHREMRDLAARISADLCPVLEYAAASEGTVEERAAGLEASRRRDTRLGWTSEGPHRARLLCKAGGSELAQGASRGYARLYSILLRLALARTLEARLGEPPVVLLDDPESELDARWIGPVLELIPGECQVIATGCRPLTAAPERMAAAPIEAIEAIDASGVEERAHGAPAPASAVESAA